MKIRKRMGMPKICMVASRRANSTVNPPISEDMTEMRQDRARGIMIPQQQHGANERSLLELAASSHADSTESTPVRFAERIASLSEYFTATMKREAEPPRK